MNFNQSNIIKALNIYIARICILKDETLEQYSEFILDVVSANVKKYRELQKYTQMQLALEIGLSGGAYLGRAELRKPGHHFNLKHIAKISKILNIPLKKFFEVELEENFSYSI